MTDLGSFSLFLYFSSMSPPPFLPFKSQTITLNSFPCFLINPCKIQGKLLLHESNGNLWYSDYSDLTLTSTPNQNLNPNPTLTLIEFRIPNSESSFPLHSPFPFIYYLISKLTNFPNWRLMTFDEIPGNFSFLLIWKVNSGISRSDLKIKLFFSLLFPGRPQSRSLDSVLCNILR